MKSKKLKAILVVIITIAVIVGIFYLLNGLKSKLIEKRISMTFTKESEYLKVKLHISSIKMLSKRNILISTKKRRDDYNLKLFGDVELQNIFNRNISFNLSGIFLLINNEKCPTEIARPYILVRDHLKVNEIEKIHTYWVAYNNHFENILEKNMLIELDQKVLRILGE